MAENYLFINKRGKPVVVKFLSVSLFLYALSRLFYSPLSGAIMALSSAGMIAYQVGVEINFADRKFRNVSIYGPQRFGTRKALPELKYVSLFKTNLIQSVTGRSGTSLSQKAFVIQVNLITEHKKRIMLYEGKDLAEAVVLAKKISKELEIDIWDATIRPADWYKDAQE